MTLSTRRRHDRTGQRPVWWKFAVLLAVWAFPVAVLTILTYGVGPAYGFTPPRSLSDDLLFVQLPLWGGWAAATPLIFRLSARHHPESSNIVRPILVHAGAAVLVLLAHTTLLAQVQWRAELFGAQPGFWSVFGRLLPQFAVLEFVIYPAVAATGFGLHMMRVSQQTDRRASRLETQLSEARLDALRMQLHPHFLFNALNTVVMQMRRGAHEEALGLLLGFSDLLREILDLRRSMIPLREEIELARQYLAIERARFGDRLEVAIEEDPDADAALVPTLLLQPLIENALSHGVDRYDGNVSVQLTTARRGALVHVELYNQGPPLPPGWTPDTAKGRGLKLTRARVREAFDERGSVDIRSVDRGVTVSLSLPFRRVEEAVAVGVAS